MKTTGTTISNVKYPQKIGNTKIHQSPNERKAEVKKRNQHSRVRCAHSEGENTYQSILKIILQAQRQRTEISKCLRTQRSQNPLNTSLKTNAYT